MKTRVFALSRPVLVAAAVGGIIWASAGSLDPPPGPITSTMKTLTEVEPRTQIHPDDLPMTISHPGSYYLTGDFMAGSATHGIYIEADNVTLDLNGFTLDGDNVGTDAIGLGGRGRMHERLDSSY